MTEFNRQGKCLLLDQLKVVSLRKVLEQEATMIRHLVSFRVPDFDRAQLVSGHCQVVNWIELDQPNRRLMYTELRYDRTLLFTLTLLCI